LHKQNKHNQFSNLLIHYILRLKNFFFILFLLFISLNAFSQEIKKIDAVFANTKPKIDGLANDTIWQKVPIQNNFIQFEPFNGEKPSQKTSVKVCYDNQAIYILAICNFDSSGVVYKILSQRDDFGQADYFGFYIDPYNNGITGYGFFATSTGVQIDLSIDNNNLNYDWDAVWFSAVTTTDKSFIAEFKIPYSAFRFPNKEKQNWSINFYRNIQNKREITTWNYVDNTMTGILNQMGEIELSNPIKPPVRLSLMPYISAYGQKYTNNTKIGKSYSGGLDLKYGINESFTIDMMLIPDYNQIQSDDQTLNLSPYETFYDEKRFFFTEGVDIFNKGDIFYSRRIGKEPTSYNEVSNLLNNNEIIIKNPQQTQIFNATKFSGKTNKGFGIGFLNAFTGSTYAVIEDTVLNRTRKMLTEPFSNYNIISLNQPLPYNSYLSLTNTNFASFGRDYYANVFAQEANFRTKKNTWAFFERFVSSQIFNDTLVPSIGYAYKLSASKNSGNFRFSINQNVYSNNFNPNDLGYLKQNNKISNSVSFAYNFYKPFGYFLLMRNSLTLNQESLYKNLKYISTSISINNSGKFLNNLSYGIALTLTPYKIYDYFEPRLADMFWIKKPSQSLFLWTSSNYAKEFANDFSILYYATDFSNSTENGYSFSYSPRVRLSNNALLIYSYTIKEDFNNLGFASFNSTQDTVFFGKRNIKTITNLLQFDYIFNKNISTNIRIRHYWSQLDYFEYFFLHSNGYLFPLKYSYRYFEDKDQNYNIYTLDFIFKWIFKPGSEFSIVYKQQIISNSSKLETEYYNNFEQMYFLNEHLNSLSFKLIFYIDYNSIFK